MPGGHVVKVGGSVTTGYGEPGSALVLEAANGNLGQQPYAVVYGLLSNPQDTVTARTNGRQIAVHKVTLPVLLHAPDVLIYRVVKAQARSTPVTVTGYTANGTIDRRRHFDVITLRGA